MDHIPILQIRDILLVSIQVDMHDRLALALQDDLTNRIVSTGAKGVLIDISALDIVDSFIGRTLSTISAMARILDAQTVVVGMQPAVAITRDPNALASWIAVVPIPDAPPWTSSVSPGRSRPRSKTLVQTVKVVSGTPPASAIGRSGGTGSAFDSWTTAKSA